MANFYLSHWNDPQKVFVPEEIHLKFRTYHFSIVRSLYRCIQKKYHGVMLNYDDGINIPLAFQALWQALIITQNVKLPILVITSDDNIVEWHFHVSKLSETAILNDQNYKNVLENNNLSVILVPQCKLKFLQAYRENQFSFVVIEDFDIVATKVLFKKLSGQFNVALTKRNFMIDRDFKVLWHILNWITPGEFGKLSDFAEFDRNHLENLRNPYDEIWYSYNHNIGDYNFDDDNENEKMRYREILRKWAKQNNLSYGSDSKKIVRNRKTKLSDDNITGEKRLKKCNYDIYDASYHEAETQLVEQGTNSEKNNEKLGETVKIRGIRDVTDLNYSKLMRARVESSPDRENGEKSLVEFPFLRSENVNMNRKTFKFLDDENKKIVDCKQLKENKNNKILETSKTSSMQVDKGSFNTIDCSINDKGTEVCEKSSEVFGGISIRSSSANCRSSSSFQSQSSDVLKQVKDKLFPSSNSSISKYVDVQKQTFPSLEDILTFKKKNIDQEIFTETHEKQLKKPVIREDALKSISDKMSLGCGPIKEGFASLEEVFKGKRKVPAFSQIMKKLNAKSSDGIANCEDVRMIFSFQDDLKRMKLCEPRRFLCTDSPLAEDFYKKVDLVSKATQTNNNHVSLNIANKKQENTTCKYGNLRNGKLNGNPDDVRAIKRNARNGFVVKSKLRNGNVYSGQDLNEKHPLKNSDTAPHCNNEVDNEEKELLLSIVEGRFVSQPIFQEDRIQRKQKLPNDGNDIVNGGPLKRYNSKTLLGSLFGHEAECLVQGVDGNSALKTTSDGLMNKDNQSSQHLKVRTIDQINGEKSSQSYYGHTYNSSKFSANSNKNVTALSDTYNGNKLSSLFF